MLSRNAREPPLSFLTRAPVYARARLTDGRGGYNAQSAAPVHFGWAKLEPVTVEVTFMTKSGRKKQTMKNVKPADYYGKSLVIRQAN